MFREMYVATSGALALQKNLDTITNNMANVNTPGFKADQVIFESFLKGADGQSDKNPPAKGANNPRLADYVAVRHSYTNHSQGALRSTGNPLDIALEGKGFLAVMTYEGERYTRNGSLTVNSEGMLSTAEGHPVMNENDQPVYINDGMVTIDDTGSIWVMGGEATGSVFGSTLNGQGSISEQYVGKLKLVDFANREQLKKEGNGLFRADKSAIPKKADSIKIEQGFLEGSNVNIIRSMTELIESNRSFETYQKLIQTSDSMTGQLLSKVGR